jgi:t-SNARE complex subunit (syntaxin)
MNTLELVNTAPRFYIVLQLFTLIIVVFIYFNRIDANVEDAHLNIEAAHTELVKYFQSVTSNRWLMIKIFGVLIIFFIIFVVFVL